MHLPSAIPTVEVNTFPGLESSEFKEYLRNTPIHFVMAHDGAHKKTGEMTTKAEKCSKILLRAMIWYFNTNKLNVALINQIEFRDSKVFTMIVESFTPRAKQKLAMTSKFTLEAEENQKKLADIRKLLEEEALDSTDLKKAVDLLGDEDLSESSLLSAYVASIILKNKDCDVFLASAFILQNIVAKHISLSQRRFPVVSFDEDFEDILDEFFGSSSTIARKVIEDPVWKDAMESQEIDCDIMDLVDGRLFRVIIQAMCDKSIMGSLPESAKEDWDSLREIVKKLSGDYLSLDGSIEPASFTNEASEEDFEPQSETLSVLKFSSPVFNKHLDVIHVTADASIESRLGSLRLYRETTHWHNHRKPLTIKAPAAQVVSKWRYVISLEISESTLDG
jgi:hypothetical protein